ncbi:NADH:flavin oxidoreductase/NADH oxidase family protein [Oceanisphaera arctica]|uniref:Oxidoreductase n=1 Tax=Oceanisphaera arctica TaxID=641510 RepID=A0A2P5TQH0_9GAMM|nr:NADH:flavin oxidoreductase/NADH oxidase family protein [Oceanisphaera arctica]PPL17997.1 oxidoreductase [Oceanisphaera arctica]GHA09074.1 oxidoreductase [Oceanisphaera arctica]
MTQPTTKYDFSNPESVLGRPLELPCGVILKNRLTKSAMSDSLGDGKGNATEMQARLYERWAEGGVALSLIGEVQGDPRYPEKPGNLVLGPDTNQKALRSLARRGATKGAHLWPQLGHAGALSHLPISRPKGPSSLDIEGLQCAGMTIEDIEELPGIYARAASIAKDAGFGGVQIHAGHGFLLSQFLSPLFNRRTDGYGGSIDARFRIVGEVIEAVRQAVGTSFPIAIKINSTDKLEGGLTESEAMEVVRILDKTSIDLIDISGGTYFPGAVASSDGASGNGPYFLDFARRVKKVTAIPVMATGGFKTRQQAVKAVESGAVDMVGVARAMALNPYLTRDWLSVAGGDPVFPKFEISPSGGVTAWYSMRLTALAEDNEDEFTLCLESAMRLYEERDAARCDAWRNTFSPTLSNGSKESSSRPDSP